MISKYNVHPLITYNEEFEMYWPVWERPSTWGSLQSKVSDILVSMKHITERRMVCVQAGGHVGVWPLALGKHFAAVHTFEAEPVLAECCRRNVNEYQPKGIFVSQAALGDKICDVQMRAAHSGGSTRIDPAGPVTVRQTTIDAVRLQKCDAIFLDIEGHEVPALIGAAETIKKFAPVITVEILPRSEEAIRAHMSSIGYKRVERVHGDEVYVRG